jgi:hypothetical protein
MVLALAIIVVGGLAILSRLRLLEIAVSFWLAFAAALGVLSATGHSMTARWHLGPIAGLDFWRTLAISPEILVFLFFMITDPKTIPGGRRGRIAYAVAIGLLAALLIASAPTEYWSKVAVLGALTLVCATRPLAGLIAARLPRRPRPLLPATALVVAACFGGLVAAGIATRATPDALASQGQRAAAFVPPVTILPSQGVDSPLTKAEATRIGSDLMADLQKRGHARVERIALWLEPGLQGGSTPVARLEPGGTTLELALTDGRYLISRVRPP